MHLGILSAIMKKTTAFIAGLLAFSGCCPACPV